MSAEMRLAPDLTLVDGRFEEGRAVADGRVTGIASRVPADAAAPDLVRMPGKALLPGTVNAHCHTFQSLLRGLGDDLDLDEGNENAEAVIRAARDVGIRLVLARTMYDWEGAPRYAMSPQAVTDVWVRGRPVVKSQRLTTLDQDAMMERVRVLTRDWKLA